MSSSSDIIQIQQLIYREREARDRQWWEEMRDVYHPDAEIRLSWYQGSAEGFIDGSRRQAQKGTTASHSLGPACVRMNGARALATLSAVVQVRTILDGIEVDLESHTRLLYRAVKVPDDGAWKLRRLDCHYLQDNLHSAKPGEHLLIDSSTLEKYRPAYRCLSYVLARHGLAIDQDLPGDDRPQLVRKLYDEAFTWLRSRDAI